MEWPQRTGDPRLETSPPCRSANFEKSCPLLFASFPCVITSTYAPWIACVGIVSLLQRLKMGPMLTIYGESDQKVTIIMTGQCVKGTGARVGASDDGRPTIQGVVGYVVVRDSTQPTGLMSPKLAQKPVHVLRRAQKTGHTYCRFDLNWQPGPWNWKSRISHISQ